ncbi:MAG: hypothetical protein A2W83_04610 [Sulfuricurvum sp. RIFCSPLOWO2_12_43_5]|nr:MAG: hypothetical protein A2W83_04610 [Sulfuricurvum sp. RIFCSPLOWO2_12_43_5]
MRLSKHDGLTMNKRAIDTDIVLIDIIDFSRLSMDEQLEIISYLSLTYKKMIEKMVKISGIPMEKMLQGIIPTGDGFYDFIAKEYPYFKGIRVAVHTGKVHRFEDILGHENFVGDGLNECSRYIEIKNLIISTVIISDRAYEILQEFLHLHNDFRKLLETCEFRHSSLHTFQDKHNITRNGYLIWMRKGAIIPPPQINLAPPAKKR